MTSGIAQDDSLARFLLSEKQFAVHASRVKYGAFLPPPSLKLSLFATSGLAETPIWELGYAHVEDLGKRRSIRARADLSVRDVLRQRLELAATVDPPRHVNAVGWPQERERQIAIAQSLAEVSRLRVDPRAAR